MKTYRKFRDALIDDLRSDPAQALAYLQTAFEEFAKDSDTGHLLLALRNVVEARGGVPELARQVNMGKTSLYRAISENGNPTLLTIKTILLGLGYKMTVSAEK